MTLWLIIIASLFPVTVEVIYSFVLLRVLRKKLDDLVIEHGNIQEYVTVVFANVFFLKKLVEVQHGKMPKFVNVLFANILN